MIWPPWARCWWASFCSCWCSKEASRSSGFCSSSSPSAFWPVLIGGMPRDDNPMNAPLPSEREGRRPACLIRWMAAALLWVLLALLTLWATAALYFDTRISWLRLPLAIIYALGMLVVWVLVRRSWKAVVTVAGFVLVLGWWLYLKPSNDGYWQPDVAVLTY